MVITRQSPRTPDDVIMVLTYVEAQRLLSVLDAATVQAASLQSGEQLITGEITNIASTFYHAIRKAGVTV